MATIQDELQLTSADATELKLPIAGIGSRSYAFIVDWHIRILLALAWLVGAAVFFGLFAGGGLWENLFKGADVVASYLIVLPPLLFFFLYHPILEIALKGRTPGKRAAGIRIVTLDGQTPDASALLIRNLFRLVDSLPIFYIVGLVTVLLTARQVRIGDMAAGTVLAHEKKLTGKAFERFATPDNAPLDLPIMEVAQDLLARWNKLAPEKRAEIATKLIASQGQTLPENVSKRELNQELRKRLQRLAHASRN